MKLTLALVALAALSARAQDVRPRWTDSTTSLDTAEERARSGHEEEAVDRFLKVMEDPDTADIFVGDPDKLATLRGLRAIDHDVGGSVHRWGLPTAAGVNRDRSKIASGEGSPQANIARDADQPTSANDCR